MIGAASLKGQSAATVLARQRLTAISRSNRSISTFRSQTLRSPAQRGPLGSSLSGNAFRWAPLAIGPAVVRFNSTYSETPSPPEVPAQLPEYDDPALFDPASIPEGIGYLHQLGLNYGIGPSSVMQWLIEHTHVWTGLPWFASIFAVGIMLRVALLKPMIDSSDNAARMHNAKPELDPLRAEMIVLRRTTSGAEQVQKLQEKQEQIKEVSKSHGIKVYKSMVPLLQLPFAIGMFRVVNAMTDLPVPALTQESFLWIQDLTVADPYRMLPLLGSAMLYLTLKKGNDASGGDPNSPVMKLVRVVMPVVSGLFMLNFSSALQLYFLGTGAFSLGQTYVLNDKRFRKAMNLTEIVTTGNSGNADILNLTKRFMQEQQEQQDQEKKLSFIDRKVHESKAVLTGVATVAQDKIQSYSSSGPLKNADGSTLPPPRLTAAQKKEADEYEKSQMLYQQWKIDEQNKANREEHKERLAQKAKAKPKAKQDSRRQKTQANRK